MHPDCASGDEREHSPGRAHRLDREHQTRNRHVLSTLRGLLDRGVAAEPGADIDPIELHMSISALSFTTSRIATFSRIFETDTARRKPLHRREVVVTSSCAARDTDTSTSARTSVPNHRDSRVWAASLIAALAAPKP
jgi:hypothetical protein